MNWDRLLRSEAPRATILIRLLVGGVFLSEGIQKFVDPATRGSGRFEKIGIPFPELMGPFVGGAEIVCGVFVLAGCLTRLAVLPLIVTMLVAIVSTKIPILMGRSVWGFALKPLSSYGVLSMAHEARTDFAMLLACVFLLIVGAGPWAFDRRWRRKMEP